MKHFHFVFTSGCEDNPSFSTKQNALQQQFEELFPLINLRLSN